MIQAEAVAKAEVIARGVETVAVMKKMRNSLIQLKINLRIMEVPPKKQITLPQLW